MNKTIIYYTSNQEDPIFEQKIIEDMLSKKGSLPVISVSQKPMDLGRNICVGEVGYSYINEWRQILIGAKQATTDYLITAESDFLYPPEYFQFEPKGENIYRYDNVWIMWLNNFRSSNGRYIGRHDFHRKYYSEGAQIVKREYLIGLLEGYLKTFPEWSDQHYREFGSKWSPYLNQDYIFFHGGNPCISIKTGSGVSRNTGCLRGPENISNDLPYWGNINDLKKRFKE